MSMDSRNLPVLAAILMLALLPALAGCSAGGDDDDSIPGGVGAGSLPEDGIFATPGGSSLDTGGTSAIPEDGIFASPSSDAMDSEATDGDDWSNPPGGDDDSMPPVGGEPDSPECCTADNPCSHDRNQTCNCGFQYSWDVLDCAGYGDIDENHQCICSPGEVCLFYKAYDVNLCLSICGDHSECASGCCATLEGIGSFCAPGDMCPDDGCCGESDRCNRAEDGNCDCGGLYAWDSVDCLDEQAPPRPDCCDPSDPCGLGGNGSCDCAGLPEFEEHDCQELLDPCPEGEILLENEESGDKVCAAPCKRHEDCEAGCCAEIREGGAFCLPPSSCE